MGSFDGGAMPVVYILRCCTEHLLLTQDPARAKQHAGLPGNLET